MTSVVGTTRLDETTLADLQQTFRGELVSPTDPSYDEVRQLWNGAIDKRPALIARCAGVADIRAAVRFAREHELAVAVRGGGHSFPGLSSCDAGLQLDLRPMNGIRLDPDRRTVRAQSGVLLGDLDRELQDFGLVVPAGIVTHTGLAGLTLGGGIGMTMRKFGLTVDQLQAADVVTADGEYVHASDDENADLFWGLRGGGGNFGVVTEFEFRLNKLGPTVMAGPVFWAGEDASKVLRFYRDWLTDCPDELTTVLVQRRAPAAPFIPAELHGQLVIGVTACYAGSVDDGERVCRPLKEFGTPLIDLCLPKPFVTHQATFDPAFRPGCWYYVRSCDIGELSDGVIDVMSDHGMRITSPITSVALWQRGGAVARVSDDATAFHGRSAGFTFNINGNVETGEGFEEQRAWARDFWTALAPWHTSVYVNFLMEEGEERIRQAYGAAKYDRLKALKRKYDPTNFFRLNQNISPG